MNVKNMSAQGGSQPKADQPRAGATILGRKKILFFITQSEFGGAQRYCLDLANNLKIDFEVAVALGEQVNNGKLAKILKENNIKYFIVPRLKRNISIINDILAFFQIIKLIKSYRPDIVHLNSSKISILGSMATSVIKLRVARLAKAKPRRASYELRVFYTVHGWVFNEPLPVYLKYFYLWAEKFTAKFKDKIICVSEYDRQTALRYKIAPAEKMVTIHNGVSPINFYTRDEARKQIFRVTSYELRATRLLIGSIGNLYKTKGFEYFVQAADILVNQYHLAATFIIIGEGRERTNLENFINQSSLKNNFILTGQIDDAARILPALDIYVCSSVKEGLPYSVLEAMQAGLPVAATSVGGIPEMIINEKTGLLSKPAEPNELAKNIKLLIDNKSLRAELGARAKEKVIAEFNLEKMVEETKKAYG